MIRPPMPPELPRSFFLTDMEWQAHKARRAELLKVYEEGDRALLATVIVGGGALTLMAVAMLTYAIWVEAGWNGLAWTGGGILALVLAYHEIYRRLA